MKINSSNVQLSAASVRTEYYSKSESLEFWGGNESAQENIDEQPGAVLDLGKDEKPEISYSQKAAAPRLSSGLPFSDEDHALITMLQRMIEMLTGKKFRFSFLEDFSLGSTGNPFAFQGASSGGATSGAGWGLIASSREYYHESETVSFNGEGTVETADGKSISFSVDLSMSRQFAASNSFDIRLGEARLCDPLVINYNASSASFTSTKFSFDLDSDGKSDQISSLGAGSGFLALDKNGDGVVNNGTELFGTSSGDGFADLSAYDSDGNQWIDENDDIYDKLRIWARDESGNSRLIALGEKGIGAIYLGNVGTEYGFKNSANETDGQLRKTGVFLRENGTAGTIQHVDMAI